MLKNTRVPKALIPDQRLSLTAKGLFYCVCAGQEIIDPDDGGKIHCIVPKSKKETIGISNTVLFDKRISYAAKAVFVVVKALKCKSGEDIKAYCKDDYLTILLSVKELVAAGHLKDGEVTL